MLKISKKVEYALISMLHMSRKGIGILTTARELSQIYHIPQELMGKVLQQLVKHALIESVQGAKGGYRLVASLEEVNLTAVINAMDGPLKLVNCLNRPEVHSQCLQESRCTIRNPMEIVQRKLEIVFSGLSLRDIENDLRSQTSL